MRVRLKQRMDGWTDERSRYAARFLRCRFGVMQLASVQVSGHCGIGSQLDGIGRQQTELTYNLRSLFINSLASAE